MTKAKIEAGVNEGMLKIFGYGRVVLASSVLVLAGCAGMVNDANIESQAGLAFQGKVHGGQQPVAGATIQLYAAQATGYGVASAPLIASTVLSDANGNFTISKAYTCPASPNDEVYLVATGGNPGAGVNANLSLMAALGPCGNLSAGTFISVNEVTTVASAYALSGFMTDYKHVSTSTSNSSGMRNAFATVGNLVNTATGLALTATPAYQTAPAGTTAATFRSVVPQAELDTLADILAPCVNSNGVGGSSTLCSTLFTAAKPPAGTAPADTIQAALDIALFPGNNVASLYGMINAAAPFMPTLTAAPNDWTVALNFISGGLGGPPTPVAQDSASSDLAIDGSGNIWISNFRTSTITELSNLGAPITSSTVLTPSVVPGGYTGGGLSNPNAIAIDTNGSAWTANSNGTISEFLTNGSAVGTGFSGGGLTGSAKGVAIDGNNNVWVASSTVSEFSTSGTAVSPAAGYTSNINTPTGAIAIDSAENVWVVNGGSGQVVRLSGTTGAPLYTSVATLTSPTAYASIDGSNQLFAPQGTPNSNLDLFNVAASFPTTFTPSSGSNLVSTSVDGAGNVWIVNAGGANGISANVTEVSGTGTLLSTPGTGYQGTGTALISSPRGSGLDTSGNLWISNGLNLSTVTEFVGIGSPTITPLALAVKNAKIGTKP